MLVKSLVYAFVTFLLGAASVAAHAQANAIEAINVTSQSGGKVIIKVTLKETPANPPAGFAINNPPRIAFDFPNTGSTIGRSTQDVAEGDLRSINVVQAGDRTRLVLNLARAVSYDTQIDGKALLITLQGPARPVGPLTSPSRGRAISAMLCATSISGVVTPAKAASSWISPTARSASTSSCRAGLS
jgi:Cu/Zn superoxide dismutase